MSDLWKLIGKEFASLIRIVSRVLANRDADFQIQQALMDEDCPWPQLIKPFKMDTTYPKNVVQLVFASDVLQWTANAIAGDGEVDEEEFWLAYSLAHPLAEILADALDRYAQYRDMEAEHCLQFFQDFIIDNEPFGGGWVGTKNIGASLVGLSCQMKGDNSAGVEYESIIRKVLTGVFRGAPVTVGEQKTMERAESIFSLISSAAPKVSSQNTTRNPKQSTSASTLPYVMNEDDNLISQPFYEMEAETKVPVALDEGVKPEAALDEAMSELESLIGLDGVKVEVKRLMSFLKIQQQRRQHGLRESAQTLHFVFTGNPGTGKTTVARIVSKILYGFRLLKTTKVIECSRSDLVGGYLGQTAIKTDEKIESALDGVLFIDEAYTLAGDALRYGHGDMYGDEAINTLLKRMEDDRDRLVVIAAGYPKPMEKFVRANPGLESRFTRYIKFDDYTIADLCRIFEKFCRDAEYTLSASGRAHASILFTIAYNQRDERFGNARFIRNVFEKAVSLHSERLANLPHDQINHDSLVTLDASDFSFECVKNVVGAKLDVSNARWAAICPSCGKASKGRMKFLGQRITCNKCNRRFMFPWWSVLPETVKGVPVEYLQSSEDQRGVVEQPIVRAPQPPQIQPASANGSGIPPVYDNWKPDRRRGASLLQEGLGHLKRRDCVSAIRCFEEAIRVDWPGSDPSNQPYYLSRANAFEMNGDDRPMQAIEDYQEGHRNNSMGHYQQSRDAYLSAIKNDPEFLWASNNLAWLCATSPEASVRNGEEAVKFGLHACRNSDWHCWSFISTLAASYAEVGDFEKAVQCSDRSLKLAPPEWIDCEQDMMDCFRSRQPYRQD